MKITTKRKLLTFLWLTLSVMTVVLLGAAIKLKNNKLCTGVYISINYGHPHFFIDSLDVRDSVLGFADLSSTSVEKINLMGLENKLAKSKWVNKVRVYVDKDLKLQVKLWENIPVARIFTVRGLSYYLDTLGQCLPLHSDRPILVPVFTNFPFDGLPNSLQDSLLWNGIVQLGKAIVADSFWSAQIAQIYITPAYTFQLVPTLGDHIVNLGGTEDLMGKMDRLYTFYKQAWPQNGLNSYNYIDLRYQNQVVAVRKGAYSKDIDTTKNFLVLSGLNSIEKNFQKVLEVSKKEYKETIKVKKVDSLNLNSKAVKLKKPTDLVKTEKFFKEHNNSIKKPLIYKKATVFGE